jgi:hypothetical protein
LVFQKLALLGNRNVYTTKIPEAERMGKEVVHRGGYRGYEMSAFPAYD